MFSFFGIFPFSALVDHEFLHHTCRFYPHALWIQRRRRRLYLDEFLILFRCTVCTRALPSDGHHCLNSAELHAQFADDDGWLLHSRDAQQCDQSITDENNGVPRDHQP